MVRRANHADLEEIVGFAEKFLQVSPYKNMYDVAYLKAFIGDLLYSVSDQIVLIEEGKGMLVGMIRPFYLGYEPIATELGWWVEPEYRNSGIGRELIHAFEDWARDEGCKSLVMISLDEELGRYYEKNGYRLIERSYMKEIN